MMAYLRITPLRGLAHILTKQPHDVVITTALRTPITRAYKGHLKDTYPEQLLYHLLRSLTTHNATTPPLPSLIEDIHIGTVLSELSGAKAGRMAAIHSGITTSAGFLSLNRACASGLSAISSIANSIRLGTTSIGIGGGVESMTRNYGSKAIPTVLWPNLADPTIACNGAQDGIMPMGITSENVAKRYGISREEQDKFALRSHTLAAAAQARGDFNGEIIPITCQYTPPPPKPASPDTTTTATNITPQSPSPQTVTVAEDDGIRPTTTLTSLAKLSPAFHPQGTSTAGNSSQVSDGAAGCLLMPRSLAHHLNLPILGRYITSSVIGCSPDEMGIGPALAIPKLLDATGVKKSEVDVWEINEAFASQAVYCVRELGLEAGLEECAVKGIVNPNGGAIALGHPLGATGARLVVSLLAELRRRKEKGLVGSGDAEGQGVGVVSMCIGAGQGMASMFVGE